MDDPRFAVRDRAVQTLGRQQGEVISELDGVLRIDSSTRKRRNAVWALNRFELPAARAAVRSALDDRAESVRQCAVNSVGYWRDSAATEMLLDLALDQMEQGGLTRDEVLPHLESTDAELQRTALTITMTHPEWADGLASSISSSRSTNSAT